MEPFELLGEYAIKEAGKMVSETLRNGHKPKKFSNLRPFSLDSVQDEEANIPIRRSRKPSEAETTAREKLLAELEKDHYTEPEYYETLETSVNNTKQSPASITPDLFTQLPGSYRSAQVSLDWLYMLTKEADVIQNPP
ncbi:hypothetical protein HYU18_04005 [Candidatus Woesearchaeota archaeon]|nr:hypothetical protein [Candidatus Woesearchaeota archaeon]